MPQYLEGRILLLQTQELEGNSRKAIPDFITWAQYFGPGPEAIFSGRRPHGLLFSYGQQCQKFKWPSWLVYDQNFRQRMANTQDKAWAKTHPGLYASCFLHAQKVAEAWCKTCHGTDHVSSLCPLTPPSRGRTPQQQGEGNINTGGKGTSPAGISTPRRKDADGGLTVSDAIFAQHAKGLIRCSNPAAKGTKTPSRN